MAEMIVESPDEVVAFLKAQHNLIEDMFDQVLLASDPQAREKPFVALRQLLAVHETAEEMLVHPRVRREADAGDAIVDARLKKSTRPRSCYRRSRNSISPHSSSSMRSPSYGKPCSTTPNMRRARNSRCSSRNSTPTTSSGWQRRCERPKPSRQPAHIPAWNRQS